MTAPKYMINCLIFTIVWPILSIYLGDNRTNGAEVEPPKDRPMPTFDDVADYMKTAHIMSEIIFSTSYLDTLDQDDNEHHKINERVFLNEFVCLDNGEQHFTISSMLKGKTSYYIEAANDKRIYQYRPFECQWNDMKAANFYPQLWHEQSMIYRATDLPLHMRWFGVSALWEKSKGASSVQQMTYVEDVRSQGFVRCIRWTYDDIVTDYKVMFYFEVNNDPNYSAELQLRSIILESKQFPKVSITINVLEVSQLFNSRVFNLPLGFGCQRKQSLSEISEIPHNVDEDNKLRGNFLLDIEVTASAPQTGNLYKSLQRPDITTSSSLSFQLARAGASTPLEAHVDEDQMMMMGGQQLQMMRISDTDIHKESQLKIIWDQSTGVKYTIDYTSDLCTQESFSQTYDADSVVLEFKNYVALELTEKLLHELFVSTDGYHLTLTTHRVKEDKKKLQTVYYVEKKLDYLPSKIKFIDNDLQQQKQQQHVDNNDYQVSIVRQYNVDVSSSYTFFKKYNDNNKDSEKNQDDIMYGIDEVSMFVYNKDRSQLLTKIVFQIDYSKLKSEEIKRQLFDVTPCFTQEHHDFAWISLTYPLTVRLAQLIGDRQSDIREHFAKFVRSHQLAKLGPLQLAKIEVTIDSMQSELIIRALILDRPSMLVRFQQMPNKVLQFDENRATFHELRSKQVARNKEHCGQLCKMTKCKLFSFCNNDHSCYLVHNQQQQNISQMDTVSIEDHNECTLFILDEAREKLWNKQQTASLQYILSTLQHDNYNEKLILQLLEKGQMDYDDKNTDDNKQLNNYNDFKYVSSMSKTINIYFNKNSNNLPLASFAMPIEMTKLKSVVFMEFIPIKFEIENDPLDDIIGASDDQLSSSWSDHLGSLVKEAQSVEFQISESGRKYWKLGDNSEFKQVSSTVTYEQCSLYCVDVGPKCDSFSYCYLSMQCVVSLRGLTRNSSTNSNKNSNNLQKTDIGQDADCTIKDLNCVIVRRDYLNKFIKTSIYKLQSNHSIGELSKKSLISFEATNGASDCANDCIMHWSQTNQQQLTDRKWSTCRSFDYCYNKLDKSTKYNGYLRPTESLTSKTCFILGTRQDFGDASDRLNETSVSIPTSTIAPSEREGETSSTSPLVVTTGDTGIASSPESISNSDQLTCDHYSRSYLIDFDLYENRVYNGAVDKIDYIQGMNVDECSKRCFEDTECRSFRFCFTASRRPMQSCLMSSAKLQSSDKLVSSDNCHLYFLRPSLEEYIYRGSEGADQLIGDDVPVNTSGEFTKAKMATLCIVAFLVSAFAGSLIVLANNQKMRIWLNNVRMSRIFRQ